MDSAAQRLLAELKNLKKDRKYLFSANPIKKDGKLNIFLWQCSFPGPKTKLYDNSYYTVIMSFPNTYPKKAPLVTFKNPVFHPNIYQDGVVCLDILNDRWNPVISILNILSAIQQLLDKPNQFSPANGIALEWYTKKGIPAYESKVRENIDLYHSMPDWETFFEKY